MSDDLHITKGEWYVKHYPDKEMVGVRGPLHAVCNMVDPMGHEEAEANANAIAAVPRLIQALARIARVNSYSSQEQMRIARLTLSDCGIMAFPIEKKENPK